jgi:hypothetical protein
LKDIFLLEVCGLLLKLVVGMYIGSILVVEVVYIYICLLKGGLLLFCVVVLLDPELGVGYRL